MWYSRNDMPDYLPVGWDKNSTGDISYSEQSDFLDWCRYNKLEPNGRNLKTFRTAKIYDEVASGNLGATDAMIQAFNAAGGFSPETGYDELEGLQSRMDSGNIGVLDAMDEAYLTGLRAARKRGGQNKNSNRRY